MLYNVIIFLLGSRICNSSKRKKKKEPNEEVLHILTSASPVRRCSTSPQHHTSGLRI